MANAHACNEKCHADACAQNAPYAEADLDEGDTHGWLHSLMYSQNQATTGAHHLNGGYIMANEIKDNELLRPLDPAVEAALIENRRAFLGFLARRLGGQHEAEDVLQDFYFRALSRAHHLRKSESVVAWLYRVLRSTLADHHRSKQRRARHEGAYAHEREGHTQALDTELHAIVCQCLYNLLPTLRPEYAELLWRIDLTGERRETVARALGLTVNNLAVRLHRARQALKRALLLSCEACPEHGFQDCACDRPVRPGASRSA